MLVDLDQCAQAADLLNDKLAYFDQNSALRLALGHIYEIQHRYEQAVDSYRQAALLRPDDTQVQEDVARAQLEAGNAEGAIATLAPLCATTKYLARSDVQRMLARAYVGAGRLRDARAQYVRLMKQSPGDADIWLKLGEVCLKLRDLAGALEAAGRVLELAPQPPDGYMLAGMVYRARGQNAEASRCFSRAGELAPEAAAPLILLGLTYEEQGRSHDAAGAYSQALERDPHDARAHQLLARVSAGT